MSKRKVNFQSATTEAARRELMKPVPCWERVWVTTEGSSFKVPKWVKTDKQQHFSDDEDGAIDQPLAPIIDEVMDVDEENEGEDATEPVPSAGLGTPVVSEKPTVTAEATPVPPDPPIEELLNAPPDATLSLTQAQTPDGVAPSDVLDPALALPTLDEGEVAALTGVEIDLTALAPDALGADALTPDALTADALAADALTADALTGDALTGDALTGDALTGDALTVDALTVDALTADTLTADGLGPVTDGLVPDALSLLPPDGTAFEAAQDLSQIESGDAILGGKALDQSGDPFASLA